MGLNRPILGERIVNLLRKTRLLADLCHNRGRRVVAATPFAFWDEKTGIHKSFQVATSEILGYVRTYPVGRVTKLCAEGSLNQRHNRALGKPTSFY